MRKNESCQTLENLAARFSKCNNPQFTNFNNTKTGKYFKKKSSHVKDIDCMTVNSQSVSTIRINFGSISSSRGSSIYVVNENEVIIPFSKIELNDDIKDSFPSEMITANPSTCSGNIKVIT